MKRNIFTSALESAEDAPVDASTVTTITTLEPKPEFEKEVLEIPGDGKPAKEFGTEAEIAEHDEIDAVAESQEETLAIEQLCAAIEHYTNVAFALEEIAETTEVKLDAGEPLDPTTVQLVTTALDTSGVGGPLETVALESFAFSPMVATESFVDAIKDRAEKVWNAIAKMMTKVMQVLGAKLKRFADAFRGLDTIHARLIEESKAVEGFGGKPFQNEKLESSIQKSFCAPASDRTPLDVVNGAYVDFKALSKIAEEKLDQAAGNLNDAWVNGTATDIVAQINKVYAVLGLINGTGTDKFKHASASINVAIPDRVTLDGTAGAQYPGYDHKPATREFAAGLRIASKADFEAIRKNAGEVQRSFDRILHALFNGDGAAIFRAKKTKRPSVDVKADKESTKFLSKKYSTCIRLVGHLGWVAVVAAAEGALINHRVAARYLRASIQEAKAQATK